MTTARKTALLLGTFTGVAIVSLTGVIAISWLQERPSIDDWIEQLEKGSHRQKQRAHKELVALSPQSIPALVDFLRKHKSDEGWVCLADMGDVALPELLDLMSDRYELSIREQAVNSLGYAIRHPTITNPENVARAVQALALCLRDDNPRIRMFAASRLAVTRRTALPVLGALREALNDKDDWVRIRAASAVGTLDASDQRFQTTILEFLNGKESDLRGEALHILSRIGPSGAFAFETVREIAADEGTDFVLRESAIWTLGELGPAAKTAIPLLRTLTGHDHARLRVAATKALESLEKQ